MEFLSALLMMLVLVAVFAALYGLILGLAWLLGKLEERSARRD